MKTYNVKFQLKGAGMVEEQVSCTNSSSAMEIIRQRYGDAIVTIFGVTEA